MRYQNALSAFAFATILVSSAAHAQSAPAPTGPAPTAAPVPVATEELRVKYTLTAGQTSAPITVPFTDRPVTLLCVQTVQGNVGEGQATIIRSSTDVLLDWVGIDYYTGAVARSYSALAGTHVIYCDFSGSVDIQVNSATAIQVHNAGSGSQAGFVILRY